MGKKDLIESEVEKALHLAEEIGKAEANPFLFSKIMNRIEKAEPETKRFNFRFAITVVIICLFTNLAVLLFSQNGNGTSENVQIDSDSVRTAQISSFASEYSSINNFYFY